MDGETVFVGGARKWHDGDEMHVLWRRVLAFRRMLGLTATDTYRSGKGKYS